MSNDSDSNYAAQGIFFFGYLAQRFDGGVHGGRPCLDERGVVVVSKASVLYEVFKVGIRAASPCL